jgi:mxaJ protein
LASIDASTLRTDVLARGTVEHIYSHKRFAAAIVIGVVMLGTVAIRSHASQTQPQPAKTLRICGDPENLPYSNEKLEGFENKIAALIAADLGETPTYAWWPHQRGLVRNTIDAGTCDVIFGVPTGLDFVLWTKPYYRSTYVIAFRRNAGYRITSLDAPELKKLRIGVYLNTPVEENLARHGLLNNASTYSLFFDPRGDQDRPAKLMDDLVAGTVDVAIPWGPMAGYYAKKLNAPIELVPLQDDAGLPLSFGVSMGVKKDNPDLKNQLEAAIDRRQAEIQAILEEYGVPIVPARTPQAASQEPAQEPTPQTDTASAAAPTTGAFSTVDASSTPAPPTGAAEAAVTGGATKNPFTGNADMIAEGKALYMKLGCQGCHGGGGGGGMATSVIDESWKFGSNDDVLHRLIKGQIPEQTMPKAYSNLDDEQVWKMLAFIRSLYIGDPGKIDW